MQSTLTDFFTIVEIIWVYCASVCCLAELTHAFFAIQEENVIVFTHTKHAATMLKSCGMLSKHHQIYMTDLSYQ